MMGLVALFFFTACQEGPEIQPLSQQKALNEIGKKWVYNYYPDPASSPEIMNVEVIGDTLMNDGDSARVWQFQLPNRTFYYMVQIEQDTFKMFSDLGEITHHKIPMIMNSTSLWEGNYCTDTSKVLSQQSYVVGENDFEGAWNIERKAGFCVNWKLDQNIWWDNDQGFLYLESDEMNLGPAITTIWELVSFN